MTDPVSQATSFNRAQQSRPPVPAAAPAAADGKDIPPFDHGQSPSFSDLLDIVNPLQHIPVVSYIYRKLTGDHEGAVDDVIGGTLWGGPIGMIGAMADLTSRASTGKTIEDHVVALFSGPSAPTATASSDAASVKVAANPTPAPTPANSQVSAVHPAPPIPIAAIGKALPPVVPAVAQSASMPAAAMASPAAADGSINAGDYMVFGGQPVRGAGSSGIRSLFTTPLATPQSVAAAQVPPANPTLAAPVDPAAADAAPAADDGRGRFMVFGGNGPAASSLPLYTSPPAIAGQAASAPAPAAAALQGPPAPLATPSAATSTAAPVAAASGDAIKLPPGFHPIPGRTGPAHPPLSLPPPTTGPGAVPGGKSQAMTAYQAMNAQLQAQLAAEAPGLQAPAAPGTAADPALANSPGNAGASASWFVNQFNKGMDQYQSMSPGNSAAAAAAALPSSAVDPDGAGSIFSVPGMMPSTPGVASLPSLN